MGIDFARLDRAFSPRCVAVVGDKEKLTWLRAQLEFKGKLYSVQINAEAVKAIEALGVKNYPSLLDIPEAVDLVIVSVPREVAPRILEDCIRKEVTAVHFYTAGFSETDTEAGKRLERQLVSRAREANLYLIGPNCMGIFNPGVGVKQNEEEYSGVSGPVGFISQSGTHAIVFAMQGHHQGVDINKAVSFGNGAVLDSADFLEYFGHDDNIGVIGMYLEGVKDGRRFLSVLRRVAALKPVVIWKGGRTEEGGRAIASHTGSLAISSAVWRAAVRQCGAVNVASMDELIDTIKALLYLEPVCGNRVGITGGSGGQSVAISDTFSEAGLAVPMLTPPSYKELGSFFSLVGAACRNPVDTGSANRGEMKRILEILERDANVDNLVLLLTPQSAFGGLRTSEEIDDLINLTIELRKRTVKPVMLVFAYHSVIPENGEKMEGIVQKLVDARIPTFVSLGRGACALKNAWDYYRFRNDTGG